MSNREIHKSYRESLAANLGSELSEDKRKEILEQAKETLDYKNAKKKHKEEIRKSRKRVPDMIASRGQYNKFVGYMVNKYTEAVIEPGPRVNTREEEKRALEVFKERLPGSVLVDLGCGDTVSAIDAYAFATAFDVKKYVGIDKNMRPGFYENEFGEMIKEWDIFKRIKETGHKNFPSYSFTFDDIVKALSKRTERSNFMMNGIDDNILYSEDPERENAYLEELAYHIARLTPPKGIIFGHNSRSLHRLEQYGFRSRMDLASDSLEQFWEKT